MGQPGGECALLILTVGQELIPPQTQGLAVLEMVFGGSPPPSFNYGLTEQRRFQPSSGRKASAFVEDFALAVVLHHIG